MRKVTEPAIMLTRGSLTAAILLMVMLATASVFAPRARAGSLEYPYIYKSSRTLAMGGANVAIGGRFDLFSITLPAFPLCLR